MVEFTVLSMPNLRNVDVDSFFLRFDLKYACKLDLQKKIDCSYK